MQVRKWAVTGIGVVLVWAAIGFTSYAVAWQAHKDHAAAVLLKSEHAAMAKIAKESHGAACIVTGTKPGQLSGILSIPALNLTAPVEEGTDDAELNVAVGHDPQSVWPGVNGAAVFLAHDVSYFVHLNNLQTGDLITYTTGCNTVKFQVTGTQVVEAGSPVSNTSSPSLVLDTCYPPNALFFTSKRFLVRADEVAAATKGGNLTPGQAAIAQNQNVNYTTTAPTALQAQGLTLEQNEAPMGTMQLVNSTQAFAQSPGPLNLEAAALQAYFGGLHSGAQQQTAWWQALAPGVAMPPQITGGYVSGHDSPLNVEIVSSGGVPSQVVLTTTVTISGGQAPGTYAETVTLPVHGSVVTIGAWTFK